MAASMIPQAVFNTSLKKKRAVGLVLFAIILALFLSFNRVPKLDTVREDVEIALRPESGVATEGVGLTPDQGYSPESDLEPGRCIQGLCVDRGLSSPSLLSRWWTFSWTYMQLVALGMTFAFLVAGLAEAFLFPKSGSREFSGRGIKGALKGLVVGPAMNLCSACIVPIANSFRGRGAGIEATISITQGSSTLNIPSMIMAILVFTPMLAGSRIVLSIVGALLIGPLVAIAAGQRGQASSVEPMDIDWNERAPSTWKRALSEGFQEWIKASLGYLIRLGPVMVIAGFASGLAIQWISPDNVSAFLGNDIQGVAIAATLGILINVPLLFEIPLVAALMLLGMGTAPAATLLFTAAAGGPITFWGLARVIPKRATAAFVTTTWGLGLIGGFSVLALAALVEETKFGINPGVASATVGESEDAASAPAVSRASDARETASSSSGSDAAGPARGFASYKRPESLIYDPSITPFVNIAPLALKDGFEVWNYRPGVVVFDYDRDGDHDFYVTSEAGHSNFLYRNEGDGTFVNAALDAGVAAIESNSAGAIACDLNNDGFQDLYVGARGIVGDNLDYRAALGSDSAARKLREAVQDRLFVNDGDGSFTEITESAFGRSANLRSAASIACADVDSDGWLDLYVGNLVDEDFFEFSSSSHPGHYNVLYHNKGALTFQEIAESAGVRGSQITMLDPGGRALTFKDLTTGQEYEGYDPTFKDAGGHTVGDPTGRTHATLFFDYDDDGDADLWVANDGDRLRVFRNDSSQGNIKLTPVARAMGIDTVGNWMGFAVGDYDGDNALDVFVTNAGYHLLLRPAQETPGGDCAYQHQFEWGTCLHFLLRNGGTRELSDVGIVGLFSDVASATKVLPSSIMVPDSLDPENIHPFWEAPTGLAAYDFGYGATFFDYNNDGAQDLYWLGAEIARGEGPGGEVYPGAGRMLRGDGQGAFEDITIRAGLLDVLVNYHSSLDPNDPSIKAIAGEIRTRFHENGKGLAHGDLNGDGYVDLIGTNSSGPVWEGTLESVTQAKGPMFVWLNGGGENHWTTIRLRGRMAIDGTGSNADGIGARVYVKTTPKDADRPVIQVQEVRAGSSYLSMDSIELEFGVGTATVLQEITILWPSGRTQVINNAPVDRLLEFAEPRYSQR